MTSWDHLSVEDKFAGWERVGRGRGLQFYATDEEIAEWLLETLPPSFAPYTLVTQTSIDGRHTTFERPIEEVVDSFNLHRSGGHWLRSMALSPRLIVRDAYEPESIKKLSFSGLIQVRLGHERENRVSESSIGMIDRIRHESTGLERRQPDYVRIFERLRRAMRKRLVVATICTLLDGTTAEDWPMTARAADAHVRGEMTFTADPVDLRD